jgi:hypothetical protein
MTPVVWRTWPGLVGEGHPVDGEGRLVVGDAVVLVLPLVEEAARHVVAVLAVLVDGQVDAHRVALVRASSARWRVVDDVVGRRGDVGQRHAVAVVAETSERLEAGHPGHRGRPHRPGPVPDGTMPDGLGARPRRRDPARRRADRRRGRGRGDAARRGRGGRLRHQQRLPAGSGTRRRSWRPWASLPRVRSWARPRPAPACWSRGSGCWSSAGPAWSRRWSGPRREIVADGPCDAVISGLDRELDYDALRRAGLAIRAGARWVLTNPDPTFPTPHGLEPGAGAIGAAIRAAGGRARRSAGKPKGADGRAAAGAARGRGIVVGDRADTDGRLRPALGYRFALVLSGVTTAATCPVEPEPGSWPRTSWRSSRRRVGLTLAVRSAAGSQRWYSCTGPTPPVESQCRRVHLVLVGRPPRQRCAARIDRTSRPTTTPNTKPPTCAAHATPSSGW